MKIKLTGFRQALLMAALAALLPFYGAAQQVTVNRVYDFSGGDTVNSEINYVYADSNFIIALGHAQAPGEEPYAFTAAFDYSGNLLWKKPIELPGNLLVDTIDSAYNVLIKAAPGLYVAGWNMMNVPKTGNYVSKEPFLYFFNAQGDSVRFIRLPDSMKDKQLNALALDRDGQIVASGNSQELYLTTYPARLRYFWFCQFDSQGELLQQNRFSLLSTLNWYYVALSGYRPRITKIIPVSLNDDSIHYVVAVNTGAPQYCGQIFWLDSLFNPIPPTQYFLDFQGVTDAYDDNLFIQATRLPRFEFNLVARKGHPHSYFWSFPVEMEDNFSESEGVYFCRSSIYWHAYTTINYQLDWYKAFVHNTALMPSSSFFRWRVQDRSEMAETANGDLLVQRTVYRPSDTVDVLSSVSAYYFPVLFRVEDTGRSKWGKSFQYIHTVDSGIFHRFYDLSIAPDGKIVMAGVLRSRYGVPGYDTVGKVSWLVILSDTLHDHQPQPSEPEGVVVRAAGQQTRLSVYPNPTIGNTFISLQQFKGNIQDFSWQLLSLDGRVLQTHQMKTTRELVRLNNEAPGIYFLRLFYKGSPSATVKVVKE